jgi:hypothetical protein
MRGDHSEPDAMFNYISPAQRVPKDHPLRAIGSTLSQATKLATRDRSPCSNPSFLWLRLASLGPDFVHLGGGRDCLPRGVPAFRPVVRHRDGEPNRVRGWHPSALTLLRG